MKQQFNEPQPTAASPTEILDTRGAAQLLLCSVQTLESQRLKGGGPPYSKIGRLVRYRRAALVDYLKAHEVISTSQGTVK